MALSKGFTITEARHTEMKARVKHRPILLVVDDEHDIRASLADLFRLDYQVVTVASAEEALAVLKEQEVSVIVADQRMPGMTGSELLAETCTIEPDAVRILLTGHADIEAVIQAVNEGKIFFYLTKPWNNNQIQAVVAKAVEHNFLLRDNRRLIDELCRKNEQLGVAAVAFESQEGMLITDSNGLILNVNRAFTEISGYTKEEVVGKNPSIMKSGRHNAEFYREMWESINSKGAWQGEIWDRRKNGEEYAKWATISSVRNDKDIVTHYVGAHYDITDRKEFEDKIHGLAFYDQLTGLPNRTLLRERLLQAMTASIRHAIYGGLMFIDLDNFKTINDSLGHDMGDLLLQQVAERLTLCVRAEDTVARLGGDEFVVMLPNLSKDPRDAANQSETVGEKILNALNQNYQLRDVSCLSTPSIGITLFTGNDIGIEELMKQADIAMYRSKNAGRNTMRFFDPSMENEVMGRAAQEKDLRNAVKQGQFLLYFQPQMAGDQLVGSEALVRWQHPVRGLVPPAEFITIAEETGLILTLGLWVLETACCQLASWATRPEMAHLSVAVNVSVRQFHQPDFVDQVLKVLETTGADPQKLKLELTESVLATNVDEIIEKMFALKVQGIGFSLDDFGTGYSSLSYLKRMPLDQLKIDQSFVRDVLTDLNDAVIAKTIIALSRSLGLSVIAEGVETAEHMDFLADSGCHLYQGYFFSRPLPSSEFEGFARIHNERTSYTST